MARSPKSQRQFHTDSTFLLLHFPTRAGFPQGGFRGGGLWVRIDFYDIAGRDLAQYFYVSIKSSFRFSSGRLRGELSPNFRSGAFAPLLSLSVCLCFFCFCRIFLFCLAAFAVWRRRGILSLTVESNGCGERHLFASLTMNFLFFFMSDCFLFELYWLLLKCFMNLRSFFRQIFNIQLKIVESFQDVYIEIFITFILYVKLIR